MRVSSKELFSTLKKDKGEEENKEQRNVVGT